MAERVLVTGGAGFIGLHLTRVLLERGYTVRILDNLDAQVHGDGGATLLSLPDEAEFVHGDIRDGETVRQALGDVDIISHQAAVVGVGQSMYEVAHYVSVNSLGTAQLLECLAQGRHRVRRLIVASSMAIYGEGKYRCPECGDQCPRSRPREQLEQGEWEFQCPQCGTVLELVPTDEESVLRPQSVYAITKRDHEEMVLSAGQAYGIPAVALRYFNVYGPGQALANPYTGVLAIFATRLLNGQPPVIYEDGLQTRDFVHVSDVVQANLKALEGPDAGDEVFNVGTGKGTTVLDLACLLGRALGREDLEPEIVSRYRTGDIRHCVAEVGKIRTRLGFQPTVTLADGVTAYAREVGELKPADRFFQAQDELVRRGLL